MSGGVLDAVIAETSNLIGKNKIKDFYLMFYIEIYGLFIQIEIYLVRLRIYEVILLPFEKQYLKFLLTSDTSFLVQR